MKPKLYVTACTRCGKPVTTTRQSVLHLDTLKQKYGAICEACMPPEEKNQMLHEMGKALAKRGSK